MSQHESIMHSILHQLFDQNTWFLLHHGNKGKISYLELSTEGRKVYGTKSQGCSEVLEVQHETKTIFFFLGLPEAKELRTYALLHGYRCIGPEVSLQMDGKIPNS